MALGDKLPVVMGKEKAVAGGVATLDADGKLVAAQKPAYTGEEIPVSGTDGTSLSSALSNKADKSVSNKFLAPQEFRCTDPEVTAAGIVLATDMLTEQNSNHRACISFVNQGIVAGVIYLNTDGAFCAKVGQDYDAALALATPPQVYDLPLAEGIANIVGTVSKYWMNQDSTVHVEISVQAASELADESFVATLPEGFLPAESQPRYIGNDAFLTIQTGGEIQLFLRGGGSLPAGKWICAEFNYRLSLQM